MKQFIDKARLQKLCKLAMLEVKEEEVARYLDSMNSSLEKLEALDDINVDGLKELTNPYDMALIEYPDVVSDGDKVELLMKSAPTSLYNYFVVPKVIEKK